MGKDRWQGKYRRPSKLDPHTDEIVRLYFDERWSLQKIGARFDVTHNAIAYHLRRIGCPMRTRRESITKSSPLGPSMPHSIAGPEDQFRDSANLESHIDEIVGLYLDHDWTLKRIAGRFGVASETIKRQIRRAGYPIKDPNEWRGRVGSKLDPHFDDIVRWYESGETLDVIAGRLGFTQKSIANILRRRGYDGIRSAGESLRIGLLKRHAVSEGDEFNYWTIAKADPIFLPKGPDGKEILYYKCRCVCGKIARVKARRLFSGLAKSCGCRRPCVFSHMVGPKASRYLHGGSGSRLHRIWVKIKERCNNPAAAVYKHYGGRGIGIADEWGRFEPFRDWALSAGYNETLTIDRIDVNGHYEPSNCRWVTMREQGRNRRNNRMVEAFGEVKCIASWVDDPRCVVGSHTMIGRLERGWSPESAIATPKPPRGKKAIRIESLP